MTPKRVPPSRRRFELSHPTVTTRVDRELHLALVDLAEAEAKTLAEVARDALTAYAESDFGEDEDGQEPAHGPEDHPEFQELTAEVENLRTERAELRMNLSLVQGQVRDLQREGSGWKGKAEQAEATLAQIGGPLGMYTTCFHCNRHWHQHKWIRAHRAWSCPKD